MAITVPGITKYARPSDIVTSLATITASGAISADPNYGLASLHDLNPAKPLKFETVGPIRLVYDFGSARRIDAFSLPNHNLDPGLNCVVALNATNAWGAPTVQSTMTVGADHLDGNVASPWTDLTTASGYSASGFRYLSLFVPANSVNIKLGETLAISTLRVFSNYTSFGNMKGAERPFLESIETEYGVVRVYRRRVKMRTHQISVRGNNADYADLQALADDAGGMALPWFFSFESSVLTDQGLYVRFTKESADRLLAREEFFNVDDITVAVREVSRSVPL